jgi:FAD/FMN-containing dehydrogenase
VGGAPGIGERLEAVLAEAFERDLVSDALLAQNEAQRAAFWRVRETIPEANRRIGSVASHDISVPPARVGEFVARAPAAIATIEPGLRVNCFGHLGTATCTTTSSRRKGGSGARLTRCGVASSRRSMTSSTRSAARFRPSMGSGG